MVTRISLISYRSQWNGSRRSETYFRVGKYLAYGRLDKPRCSYLEVSPWRKKCALSQCIQKCVWWVHLTTCNQSIRFRHVMFFLCYLVQLPFKPHCGPIVVVKWQYRASALLMSIFRTRFVGTKQGVLRTYPGLRLQKTYSHRHQSWSVYDCIISEL